MCSYLRQSVLESGGSEPVHQAGPFEIRNVIDKSRLNMYIYGVFADVSAIFVPRSPVAEIDGLIPGIFSSLVQQAVFLLPRG